MEVEKKKHCPKYFRLCSSEERKLQVWKNGYNDRFLFLGELSL